LSTLFGNVIHSYTSLHLY